MANLNIKYFSEGTVPGKRYGKINHNFVIDKYIYEGKTDFQNILIFQNSIYGKILVLDGIVQLSEFDEFIYHEMITHPFIFSHPNPKKILIIGGGDGGTLREVLKHQISNCIMVEIDKKVVELCRKYLPFVSDNAFDNKNLKLLFQDGKDFIKNNKNQFDIIIIDCNDPVGPSVELFTKEFYQDINSALTENGISVFQMGSFLDIDFLKSMYNNLKDVFDFTMVSHLTIPCYHCGEYCFMAGSKNIDLENIRIQDLEKKYSIFKNRNTLKYYNPSIHKSSQVLPRFMNIK